MVRRSPTPPPMQAGRAAWATARTAVPGRGSWLASLPIFPHSAPLPLPLLQLVVRFCCVVVQLPCADWAASAIDWISFSDISYADGARRCHHHRQVTAPLTTALPRLPACPSCGQASSFYLESPPSLFPLPLTWHLGRPGRRFRAVSEGVQPLPALEHSARPALSHP